MYVQAHSKENGKIVFPGALFAAAMGGDEPEAPAVEDAVAAGVAPSSRRRCEKRERRNVSCPFLCHE